MGNSGFHKSSIDIFETTEENRMDSSHFLGWIDRTASLLRKELAVKAELLDIAMKNLLEKRYEIDEAAKNYNVDILR
ncbi:unnamed protein product [Rotaria sordida]|uniref:Uncharacterized protein n=1 Tax=Rotaria sordida TaxID=392033 RepID=A0A820CWA0_9BILA|nr:unnamed protein product [Rotaria sordida]